MRLEGGCRSPFRGDAGESSVMVLGKAGILSRINALLRVNGSGW